jgi:hypothetical protein
MLVLDANILIRAALGRRVRQILEAYAARGIRFYAPDVAYADAGRYLPALLKKRGKPGVDSRRDTARTEPGMWGTSLGYSEKQRQKQMRGFFAALRMTTVLGSAEWKGLPRSMEESNPKITSATLR